MSTPSIDNDRRRALGKEIYEKKIKHLVDPQEHGKFLVLDITTGDYAVGRDWAYTTEELRNRRPDAVTYTVRIGHKSVLTLRSPRKIPWDQTDGP